MRIAAFCSRRHRSEADKDSELSRPSGRGTRTDGPQARAPVRPAGSSQNPIGCTRTDGLSLYPLFHISLCEAILFGIDTSHFVESLGQHVVRYLRVNLGGFDICVPQHPADDFDADSLSQCISRGERVARHVKRDRLVDPDFCCYFLQYPIAIGDVWYGQYELRKCTTRTAIIH